MKFIALSILKHRTMTFRVFVAPRPPAYIAPITQMGIPQLLSSQTLSPPPPLFSVSVGLPILDITFKWTQVTSGIPCLPSFSWHNVF